MGISGNDGIRLAGNRSAEPASSPGRSRSLAGSIRSKPRLAVAGSAALWWGPLAPAAEISVLVMQFWATLWCRAQTAQDCQAPNQDADGAHIPPGVNAWRCLLPRHLRLGGKAVSCSTGSNVDEVSDAIGDRDLGECDLRPDPTCDAPRLRSRAQTACGQPSLEPVSGLGAG